MTTLLSLLAPARYYVLGALVLYFSASVTPGFAQQPDPREPSAVPGANANPTNNPIGGGRFYEPIFSGGDYNVSNARQLLNALARAETGDIVFIDGAARIDLTGYREIVIPDGVTLASDRGLKNSQGALIYTNTLDTMPLFLVKNTAARVTGLRLQGPDQWRRESAYEQPNSRGIQAERQAYLEVDNSELFGWSHAAVFITKGAEGYIHHNFIHHNQRSGLGYGVSLRVGNALVEANLFDWNRHHIAADGEPNTSYEARYNIVLPNANGHSFDMHGGKDRGDGTNIAGDHISIHHNTFLATEVRAIVIRGRPRFGADIHDNVFNHTDPQRAVVQTNARGNVRAFNNIFTLPP